MNFPRCRAAAQSIKLNVLGLLEGFQLLDGHAVGMMWMPGCNNLLRK